MDDDASAAKPKDIIYMEADDAIDDIIELIKKTAHEDVLLVPPKNTELLQSRVNMKFLVRTMQEAKKNLILVTGNLGLQKLASSVGLPTAKTQANAERLLAGEEVAEEISARDEKSKDDVIDGEKLSSVLAEAGVAVKADDLKKDVAKINEKPTEEGEDLGEFGKEEKSAEGGEGKKKKVPNISKLRKRIIIGAVAGVFLIVLLVWMFVFAPAATVIVTARTTKNSYSQALTLFTDEAKENLDANQFFVVKTELKKSDEVKFQATGEKNAGEKAAGSVKVQHGKDTSNIDWTRSDITVPAGTVFTDKVSGLQYATTANAVVKGYGNNLNVAPASVDINLVAVEPGAKYNDASTDYKTEFGGIEIVSSTAMNGGTDKTVKIVSPDDIKKATEQLTPPNDVQAKNELAKQISDDYIPIEQSLEIVRKDPESSVPIGDEAAGEVTLKQETTYSQIIVPRAEVEKFLDARVAQAIKNQPDQKIYSNGLDEAFFDSFTRGEGDGTMSATLKTNYEIGPEIDEDLILERSRGGTFGEVQKRLGSINGVRNVDVKFSFFWVNKVPNNDDKITIEFEVEQ